MNKTLYVSDLDGTLLNSDERLSEKSCSIINSLVENGMVFSYATARSVHTASKVTEGLNAKIPLIVYNGAFIVDNQSKERILTNTFSEQDSKEIYAVLNNFGVSPIVYSIVGGRERFSYDTSKMLSKGTVDFLATRKGDFRDKPMSDDSHITDGEVFYFACIDDEKKLNTAYLLLRENFNCVYQKDIYSGEQWLEIMPHKATKARAALQLKRLFGCDRIISFGDGINDIPMFEISDECYAVENGCENLKKIATGIIGSNDSDGVAEWLNRHFTQEFT